MERLGSDLEEETPLVARGHCVERVAALAQEPYEHVETTGAAFGISSSPDIGREFHHLFQFGEVHPTPMQHDGVVSVEAVGRGGQLAQPALDSGFTGQEAALELPEVRAESQVQARGLDLIVPNGNQSLD